MNENISPEFANLIISEDPAAPYPGPRNATTSFVSAGRMDRSWMICKTDMSFIPKSFLIRRESNNKRRVRLRVIRRNEMC